MDGPRSASQYRLQAFATAGQEARAAIDCRRSSARWSRARPELPPFALTAVVLARAASRPSVLPAASGLPMRSSTSSDSWYAVPAMAPASSRAERIGPGGPPAPAAKAKSGPVLWRAKCSAASQSAGVPRRSSSCSISALHVSAVCAISRSRSDGSDASWSMSSERHNRRSPRRIAPGAPKATQKAGLPRRRLPPSMTSSCSRLAACTSSTADALRMRSPIGRPVARPARIAARLRSSLPPPMNPSKSNGREAAGVPRATVERRRRTSVRA